MVGLGIAYYERVYGGLASYVVAEAVLDGKATEEHLQVLRANPYLSENVALLLLHMKLKTWDVEKDSPVPSFENIYSQALLYALSSAGDRFQPLFALFGRQHDFQTNGSDVYLEVKVDKSSVKLPLPGPIRFSRGQFIFPPRYHALLARQEAFVDRYADYVLGNREDMVSVVLQR